jgi:repressor LexA
MPHPPLTRRQRDILTFLEEYQEREGISPTLEEIAAQFGISKVTIFGHVSELERKGVIRRAAPGISRGLRIIEEQSGATSEVGGGLRILGTIAAGSAIETLEVPEVLPFEELAPPDRDVYVLRVKGDSMIEDSIRDGDLVVVERRTDPRNGQTVVAVLPDNEATLKRFYREPNGHIRLQPANEAFEPIIVPEVEIRGIVIGVIRKY